MTLNLDLKSGTLSVKSQKSLLVGNQLAMTLVSQAGPTSAKEGKSPVNCAYKPCPTRMQLHNQISNNALLNTCCEVCTLTEKYSRSIFTAPIVAPSSLSPFSAPLLLFKQ